MSRIGIISDAHLFHKSSQPQLYKQTIQKLQEEGVDCIVDCGDLTDNNVLNSVQSDILYDIFSIVKIPMHIVMGNHDSLGGTSLASVLKINKNITVHTSIEVVDGMLFIPYVNSKKELKEQLKSLGMVEPVDLAFSHLMMADNQYAMLSFKFDEASKFLHRYAETVFNGHVHNYSECKTLYGTIYNVGSFSNVTFGDEDEPHYHIYDTDTKKLERYPVVGGIMHKTVVVRSEEDIDTIKSLQNKYGIKFNWRIRLPADFDFKIRNRIKEKLYDIEWTNNVQFDYLESQVKQKQAESVSVNRSKIEAKISLIDQLFDSYEQYTGCKLDNEIKQQLKG